MSGDEVGEVDIVLFFHAGDETHALGIRNGVGKRLRELAVAREFDDAELVELIGAEAFVVVVEAGLGGLEHVVEVVFVAGRVKDLQIDVFVFFLLHLVAAGEIGEKIERVGRAHIVFVEVAAIFGPLALEVSGSDGGLIAGRADDGVVGDPVGLRGEEIDALPVGVAAFGHLFERGEFFFGAAAGIVEFDVAVVADVGEIGAVEKCAVVGEFGALVAVAEAVGFVADVESHVHDFAGLERLIERVDGVDVARAGRNFVEGAIEIDGRDALERVGDVDLIDGLVEFILQNV